MEKAIDSDIDDNSIKFFLKRSCFGLIRKTRTRQEHYECGTIDCSGRRCV